jgi:predicted GH43/DUF377 family glycosyl hydrolase
VNLPNELRTPHKIGRLVLRPSYAKGEFDSHAVDCPFPFLHEGSYYMMYVGWDGIGYRTGLAKSDDLEMWSKAGIILDRGRSGSVTQYNAAMTSILRDNDLFGPGVLKKVDGRFIGTYHAYPKPGYEEGPAVIGLCYSDDLYHWEVGEPILRPDRNCAWEAGGLYKSWLMKHEGVYYMFYNAKNKSSWPWIEQTGLATSTDLVKWERSPLNPLLPNGEKGEFDDVFASDPVVLRHDNRWIMYYFGNGSDGHAREGVAVSDDLLHWRKSGEVLIDVGGEGSVDSKYAHKPGIIAKGSRLYHFYCAVRDLESEGIGDVPVKEGRGLSLATSTPLHAEIAPRARR